MPGNRRPPIGSQSRLHTGKTGEGLHIPPLATQGFEIRKRKREQRREMLAIPPAASAARCSAHGSPDVFTSPAAVQVTRPVAAPERVPQRRSAIAEEED